MYSYSPVPETPTAPATYHDFLVLNFQELCETCPHDPAQRQAWMEECVDVLREVKQAGKRDDQEFFMQMAFATAMAGRSYDAIRHAFLEIEACKQRLSSMSR